MKTVIGILVALLIVIIFSLISKKRKDKKAKVLLASDKIREEALDKLLLNKEAEIKKEEEKMFTAIPIAVNYDANIIEKPKNNNLSKKKNKNKKVMVQIVENSELSARKYMFDPGKGIFIGSKVGKNHIVINNANIDGQQCEIRENSGKVYVRNTGSSGKVVLKRGKQSAYVEQKYLEVKTGDALLIENTIYRIELVTTNEK